MDVVLWPMRVAASKSARKTYLNTFLFVWSASILFGLAVVAYVLFYMNYVPQIGIHRVIHLQYGDGPHPYGIATFDSSIVSQQAYDISLTLTLPRSPSNLAAGNFMLSLYLASPNYQPPPPPELLALTARPAPDSDAVVPSTLPAQLTKDEIIFLSRRPALLTYASRLVSVPSRLAALPLYVLGLRREAETIVVPMAEGVVFTKGWKNVPRHVLLELQAGQDVQVYAAQVTLTARFAGLRWLMYNHRIFSLLLFSTIFWIAEIFFTLVGWAVVRSMLAGPTTGGTSRHEHLPHIKHEDKADVKIKQENMTDDEPDLSDTPRTFPTYGRQPPLRYPPPPRPKDDEDDNSEEQILEDTSIQPLVVGEADDEDDGEDVSGAATAAGRRSDSGLGTSFSEGGERIGLSRRRSNKGKGGK